MISNDNDIFETERMVIRPASLTDVEDIFEYSSQKKSFQYLNTLEKKSLHEMEQYVIKNIEKHNNSLQLFWSIVLKKENRVIGTIKVYNFKEHRCEIGYMVNVKYRKFGYFNEALSQAIVYLFYVKKVENIEAFIVLSNTASCRAVEKLNFVRKERLEIGVKKGCIDEKYYRYELTKPIKEVPIKNILFYLSQRGYPYNFTGDEETLISGFSSISKYVPGTMSWIKSKVNGQRNAQIALLIKQEGVPYIEEITNIIETPDSKKVFFELIETFFDNTQRRSGIGEHTYISENVEIGENVAIGSNCTIDGNIRIGDNTLIYNNVSIINDVIIGENCAIQSGVCIGHDDLSYFTNQDGTFHMIKHFGKVEISDNVYVGAGTVINRGTIDATCIEKGTKIDANCLISHNCLIGKNVTIISGSSIYGSVKIGDNAYIASAIVKNQLTIGENAVVGMGSVVTRDVPSNCTVLGVPAKVVKNSKGI